MRPNEDARQRALAHHQHFCCRILPGTLRRIAAWKGAGPSSLSHWTQDVEQELALDCLENTSEVVALPASERHARWMRLAARVVYHLQRPGPPVEEVADELPSPPTAPATDIDVELPAVVTLHNGRPNLEATMREHGVGRRALRKQLDELSAELGWSEDRPQFWQRRTGEALTALGADVLRLQRRLRTVDPAPACPSPERRRLRLRRIASRLPVHPSTLEARRALRAWTRQEQLAPGDARRMLERACRLAPDHQAAWLWLFEACAADDDHAAAARAIRRARGCGPPRRAAVTLARARLLEARGRLPAGLQLLRRALRRGPDHQVLRRALNAAQPVPRA